MTLTVHDDYVPMIDISYAQGRFDFARARARGISFFIIRACNGNIVDEDLATNIAAARAAGVDDHQLGFYPFCNPKRCRTGVEQAQALIGFVHQHLGHIDTLMMGDIEDYTNEHGPYPMLSGPAYAEWLREMFATIRSDADHDEAIGYSNQAYWDKWVGDPTLAAELDWIVARYPVYSAEGYVQHPVPPDPAGWPAWAFSRAADGPHAPTGAVASAWQFSAGFNGMGATYGATSHDLDLNIVLRSAWTRWTAPYAPPAPPIETVPPVVVTPPTPVPTQEEPMATVIITAPINPDGSREYNASFITQCPLDADGNPIVLSVLWPHGPDGEQLLALHKQNPATIQRQYDLTFFKAWFVNEVPSGDDARPGWSVADFGGIG